MKRDQIRVHGTRDCEDFDYEGGTLDQNREVFGEENEHAETCDYIYGNCNCGLILISKEEFRKIKQSRSPQNNSVT